MNCRESKRKISLLLDRELSVHEENELKKHLAACGECRRYKDEMAALLAGIAAPAAIQPSPYFYNKVRRKIAADREREAAFSFIGFRWMNALTLSATVALTLLAGNFFGAAIWSGLQKQSSSIEAAETVAGISSISDLPAEYDGIYYTDTNRG